MYPIALPREECVYARLCSLVLCYVGGGPHADKKDFSAVKHLGLQAYIYLDYT